MRQRGPARPDKGRQPDDLAAMHGEGNVHECAGSAQAADDQSGSFLGSDPAAADCSAAEAGARDLGLGIRNPRFRGADHRLDQALAGKRVHRTGDHMPPVAQHRDGVGQLEDLFEPMRDVDDGHALPTQVAHHPEQRAGLAFGECGRRFVHDHDLGAAADGPGNLDRLHLGDTEFAHPAVGRDRDIQSPQQPLRLPPLGRAVHPAERTARRLSSHQDVLRNRQIEEGHQFLMDHRHPQLPRRVRMPQPDRASSKADFAGVRRLETRQQAHEGGLARPVLAYHRVHLAASEPEANPVKGPHARERFPEILDFQHNVR